MNRLRTLILTMGLLSGIIGHAHDFEIDGVFYNIISATELKVAVTYQGDDYWSQDEYSGVVTIPSAVTYKNNTYNVVNIASRAFSNCSNLITVEISQGVRSIDGWAFEYCNNLTDIIIPSGMVSIGTCAFLECKSLTSINIPDGVISIGKTAFSGCDKLTSINLPDGVRSIGDNTFFNCSSLVSITIPESVTSIGDNVFYNCTSLREVIMEDGNETLSLGNKNGWQSLFLDSPIETLYLGRNLSFSDNSPFHSKKELKSLTIGDKVTEIASCTFYECTNIDILTLPNSVENIGNGAFYGCNGLTSVIMGSGIYLIGSQAFFYCSSLTGLTIPESVTSIEGGAFHGCSSLSYVVIGNKVSSIGSHAFAYCTNLIDLTIGSSVSNIGNYAFDGCNEIERIYALNTKAITCDESIFATDAYNNAILYTPTDRVFAYEKATPWNKFQIEPMKKFTVTYKVNGEAYKTIEIEYAAEITLPKNPEKEGYTFIGWSEVPETMPANDITIYGTFAINKYLVTFKIGDEVIASDSLEYGTSIVIPEAPEKEGYTFNGWGEVAKTVPAGDVTYEGNYSVNSYKLTFIVDGEVVQESSVDYGTTITLPEEPTKEGYSFDGWNEIPETMPASDVTVRGTFTVNKYLVTFRINNEVIASDSLEYGASIVTPEAPEKEGYTFDGWVNVPETVPAEDVTISGTFIVNKYLVTFVIDDEVIASDSLEYGASIVAPITPEKEGHTFNGWGEVAETVPAEDVTFYGSYSVNYYLLTYVVDGENVQIDSVAYGTAIVALEEPTKEGYTFSGWSEAPETMPAEDVTISGTFIVNKYLVTFVIDDEVIASDSLEYGTAIVAPVAPEKEGHTFNGWGEVAETVPAEDVVISGSFTVNTYKVYYYVGDVLVHTAEVAYGESIPEYVYEPTAEGDEFMGWAGETYETMPAHDVTYTANIESGIGQLAIDKSQLIIYDLQGRRISNEANLKEGIYIVNGRKVAIK